MEKELAKRIRRMEDEAEIRRLIADVSILADEKNIAEQMTYFAEDAVMVSHIGDQDFELKGRSAIQQAFEGLVNSFRRSYHMNGQVSLTVEDDKASAVIYCRAFIERDDGMEDEYAVYHDDYQRQNGRWVITKRDSEVLWLRKAEKQ